MIAELVDPIWKRYYTKEMITWLWGEYRLKLGSAMLCLQNLKKRITGIKYINEAIKSVRQAY